MLRIWAYASDHKIVVKHKKVVYNTKIAWLALLTNTINLEYIKGKFV